MSVSEIIELLKVLEELRKKTYEELVSNRVIVSAVLWNLYIAVQGCIDIGLKIIEHLELRDATSYSDVFNVLYESKIISKELSEKLKKTAKFMFSDLEAILLFFEILHARKIPMNAIPNDKGIAITRENHKPLYRLEICMNLAT
ncbi:MAG: HepT-like ribonuclease domain-containing protein [Candidatus Asgardarchaeum sp.]